MWPIGSARREKSSRQRVEPLRRLSILPCGTDPAGSGSRFASASSAAGNRPSSIHRPAGGQLGELSPLVVAQIGRTPVLQFIDAALRPEVFGTVQYPAADSRRTRRGAIQGRTAPACRGQAPRFFGTTRAGDSARTALRSSDPGVRAEFQSDRREDPRLRRPRRIPPRRRRPPTRATVRGAASAPRASRGIPSPEGARCAPASCCRAGRVPW